MPKKKSATAHQESKETATHQERVLVVDDVDEIPEIQALRAELGDDHYTVRCYRKGDDGVLEKFPALPIEQFSADSVVLRYGGGEWHFDVVDEAQQFVKRFRTKYSKLIKPRQEPAEAKPTSAFASPEIQLLMQQQQQHTQLITQMMSQNQLAMAEIVKAFAAKPAESGLKDTILALEAVHKMSAPKNDSAADMVKSILPMFSKFIEIGRDSGGGGERSAIEMLIDKAAEVLPDVIQKLGNRQPAAAPTNIRRVEHQPAPAPTPAAAPVPAAAPTAAAPAPAAPARTVTEIDRRYPRVAAVIRKIGPNVMAEAAKATDAARVAGHIADNTPKEMEEELGTFAKDPEATDLIFQAYSPLSAYSEWIKQLVKALAAEYIIEEIVEEIPAGAETVHAAEPAATREGA